MITTVTIAGQAVDPDQVEATSIVVTHGRAQFTDGPTPSSATLILLHPAGSMPTWATGDLLQLDGDTGTLFTGRITDRALTHLDTQERGRVGRFTITATGSLARLGIRKVGDTPWPQEPATARAARILAAAGTPWQVTGTADAAILPRDVDAQPALALLEELTTDTAAAVFDTPSGAVIYQALSGRARPVFPWRWMDFPASWTWDSLDPTLTWDGDPPSLGEWDSPGSEFPIKLPGSAVEWEPEWASTEGQVINRVRVGWGTPPDGADQDTVEASDPDSVTRHGERYAYIGTQLATQADAQDRATHIITTQGRDRWALGTVVVLLDQLDPGTRWDLLRAQCGRHVTVQGLPQPAPASEWTGILEGWTYQQWRTGPGLDHERLTLHLSDPLWSLAVMTWADYPATYTWADHPEALIWDYLNSTADLGIAPAPQPAPPQEAAA